MLRSFLLFLCSFPIFAATVLPKEGEQVRQVEVTRTYVVDAPKGKPFDLIFPAPIAFWGITNSQEVKSVSWEYSLKPDSLCTTIFAGNLLENARVFRLNWVSPPGGKLTVKVTIMYEITRHGAIYTKSRLPLPPDALKRFPSLLVADKDIPMEDPRVVDIATKILRTAKNQEDAVEQVCDWVNENVTFEMKQDTALGCLDKKQGNCVGMSLLACAVLRKMGIPTDHVSARFINSDFGHQWIEVYFPDAGWVFYDLSNGARGFRTLDTLVNSGGGMFYGKPGNCRFKYGINAEDKDLKPFQKDLGVGRQLRPGPKNGNSVLGVTVRAEAPPKTAQIRHFPIRDLILRDGPMSNSWSEEQALQQLKLASPEPSAPSAPK